MSPLLEVRALRKEFPLLSPLLKRRIGTVAAVGGVGLTMAEGEMGALGCGWISLFRAARQTPT